MLRLQCNPFGYMNNSLFVAVLSVVIKLCLLVKVTVTIQHTLYMVSDVGWIVGIYDFRNPD